MTQKMDHIDTKILNFIEEHGGAENLKKVAKEINLSVQTVHNRVTAMKKNGMIKKAHYELDPEKLGLPILVLIAVKVSNDNVIDELNKKFGNNANSVISFEAFGAFDYLMGRYVSSTEELYQIKDELKNTKGVNMVYPVYIGHKFRFSTMPFPLKEV